MANVKLKNDLHDPNIKPGPIHQLKTTKTAMNSDWSDHRHDTTIQNTHI